MKKTWMAMRFSFVLMMVSSCLEPYVPPTANNNTSMLVIDAFVNSTDGVANVSLTHTLPLSSTDTNNKINDAAVKLVDEDGFSVSLTFAGDGVYTASGLHIDASKEYKLAVTRADDRKYESELVPVQVSPPIDELNWSTDGDLLNINVNTHDATGKSRYYRWKYAETWQYNAVYPTPFVVKNDSVVNRTADENLSHCWRSFNDKSISIYSTDYLTNDVVSNFAVAHVPSNSIKLTTRYYISVQQQTLTKEAYSYWLNIKKTTESLGSIFDPLPGSVVGNIHCLSDPKENVIGYFTVGSVTTKNLYIDRGDLGPFVNYPNPGCLEDTIVCDTAHVRSWYDVHPHYHFENPDIVIGPIYNDKNLIIGYVQTSESCTDCRVLSQGTTTKPDFWDN